MFNKTKLSSFIKSDKTQNFLHQFVFYGSRVLVIGLLCFLFLGTFTYGPLDLLDAFDVVDPIQAVFLPFSQDGLSNSTFINYSFYLIYAICAVAVLFAVSMFVKEISFKVLYYSLLAALTIYLYCSLACMIMYANTPRWFQDISSIVYVKFFIALIIHIVMIFSAFYLHKTEDSDYIEYKQLLKEEKLREKQNKKEFSIKNFFKTKRKTHIKVKILITIILTIIAILITFTYSVLTNYKKFITTNVNENGNAQAQQTANVYRYSDGLYEKINSFIEGAKKTNATASIPFERTDIIITNSKKSIFLESVTEETTFPNYDVFAYTTAKGKVYLIPDDEKKITSKQAAEYIKHFLSSSQDPFVDEEDGKVKYVYPVTFNRKDGTKLVGFSVVTYQSEIVMRPFYQTKVFIFAISLVFLYLSIILSVFLADFIAEPIIFLRGNVRQTSNRLQNILSGNANVKASSLTFQENVYTNDEIKDLSVEICGMVGLIRGIIPYISFSTLKNADGDNKRSTVSREMCFLFTDIRGFTTLCEGMSPKDVVNLLNRYLEIETQIILNNGGDIDKYAGDEIMAFFTGANKEINACKAACELRKAMMALRENSIEEGKKVIEIGIGINTGKVVFGSVGSNTRKDFTSIGDTVNLASRLEGANKEYGSKSIVSEAVYQKLKDQFVLRELDFITVKGKTEPVRIYELLQTKKDCSPKLLEIKALFEKGLAFYRKQKWDNARILFEACAQKYNDAPSKVFLKRIEHFQNIEIPKKWNGVFVMHVK